MEDILLGKFRNSGYHRIEFARQFQGRLIDKIIPPITHRLPEGKGNHIMDSQHRRYLLATGKAPVVGKMDYIGFFGGFLDWDIDLSLEIGKFSCENKAFHIDLDKIREFKPEKSDKSLSELQTKYETEKHQYHLKD